MVLIVLKFCTHLKIQPIFKPAKSKIKAAFLKCFFRRSQY